MGTDPADEWSSRARARDGGGGGLGGGGDASEIVEEGFRV